MCYYRHDTIGANVIPKLTGEEQLLIGSPAVQALQDLGACQQLSRQCQELLGNGALQMPFGPRAWEFIGLMLAIGLFAS